MIQLSVITEAQGLIKDIGHIAHQKIAMYSNFIDQTLILNFATNGHQVTYCVIDIWQLFCVMKILAYDTCIQCLV